MFHLRAFLHRALPAAWQQRGWVARLLWPLSCLYAWIWRKQQRRAAQHAHAPLSVPVLVIGNVIAGGAGKTPTCISVVQHFSRMGLRVGVLSRGYGRHPSAPACLSVNTATPAEHAGDEPLLIHRHTGVPVVVCAQRLQAARQLLHQHPDTQLLVCDDGLQHLALPRTGEICVMDERGIGNGWLLPAGPLREPWPRAVDLVLFTETPSAHGGAGQPAPTSAGQHPPTFTATRRLADDALRADGSRVPLAELQGQPLSAVAGIARPEAFFAMLRAAGLTLARTQALPDHYDFNSWQRPPDKRETLICTEKDALKLWRHDPAALAVPLVLDVPAAFFTALDGRLAAQGYHPRHTTAPAPRTP